MPAKKQITKEYILDAALAIVRESGMEGLNMRNLAGRCGCSTQPLYLSFSGVEEIKAELNKRILTIFNDFIREEIDSGRFPEYKAIGMGYIDFARQERELFKYLFMRDRTKVGCIGEDSFDRDVMVIMKNYGLYEDAARRLHAEMWVFVHGIATMYATGYLDWDWETVSVMLTDVYTGVSSRIQTIRKEGVEE